ncbi:FAD dependent oxidoreductase [Whalleya microplaca]|nr:FAD dependent oxidoreductase [Whalleya microplaca]
MTQPQLLEGQSGLPVDNPSKSYWHKEPSEKLLGHQTTKDLPHSADVVIVGSGITGSFAAHFLKEKRPELNVVMLEAREACSGATGRNGGHCQPAIYASSAPHIASFELRNYLYLKSLEEEYSIPCDWHTTSGVHAFYSADLFSIAQDIVADLTENYPDLAANVAVVTKGEGGSPAWLLEGERKELTLNGLRIPNAEGAVVQWHAASLWPYKLVAFVLERLLAGNKDGQPGSFNLQTNTPATGLTESEPPTPHNKPTWTVHTPRGTVSAPHVLLATNGYTSHLLPAFSDLLVPTRGQVSALKPPEAPHSPAEPPLDIAHTFYIVGEPEAAFSREDYLVQRPPPSAELVFGGGRQHARARGIGVWDDGDIDEPVAWYLRGELGSVVDLSLREDPAHAHAHSSSAASIPAKDLAAAAAPPPNTAARKQDLEPTYQWTGIMGYSRDGHPFVGRVPPSLGGGGNSTPTSATSPTSPFSHSHSSNDTSGGLWLCAGYTGHGMPNATLCAKAVVDLMFPSTDEDGEPEDVDLPPEYELSEKRVAVARLRDEVAVVDKKGSLYMEFGAARSGI